MSVDPGSIEHLSQIIEHVVAPAFMLGAVASFVSILVSRSQDVQRRIRDLKAADGADPGRNADLDRLKRRAELLHRAVILSIGSGAAAALLIMVAFGAALIGVQHVWFAAGLFIISMFLLLWSLLDFAREIKIGLAADHEL
jgi:hypothetical protein